MKYRRQQGSKTSNEKPSLIMKYQSGERRWTDRFGDREEAGTNREESEGTGRNKVA